MSTNLNSSNDLTGSAMSPHKPVAKPFNGTAPTKRKQGLSRVQAALAMFFLCSWFFLFAGGITLDTTKFRCVISPNGAMKLAAEGSPGQSAGNICNEQVVWVPAWPVKFAYAYMLGVSWVAILLFFLPLNLAMVSSAAGTLGALGNKANLEDDRTPAKSRDDSSPLMSGVLRGLFVYLFFISGLLLFDDKPFSTPGPGQYIRLAGFISLVSFLVNYRPNLFASISDWAYERINSRRVLPVAEGSTHEITVKKTKTHIKTPLAESAANGNGEKSASSPSVNARAGRN